MQPLSSSPLGPVSCRCTAVVEMWKERVRAFEAIVHTLHLMLTHAAINSDAVGEGRTAAQARRLSSHIPPPYRRPLDPPPSLPAWTPPRPSDMLQPSDPRRVCAGAPLGGDRPLPPRGAEPREAAPAANHPLPAGARGGAGGLAVPANPVRAAGALLERARGFVRPEMGVRTERHRVGCPALGPRFCESGFRAPAFWWKDAV